jgi:hypothetical protein
MRVTRTDGVAVHGGALEVRERVRREDVFGKDPIQRVDNVDWFRIRLRLGKMREHQVPRCVWREESQEFGHFSSQGSKVEGQRSSESRR